MMFYEPARGHGLPHDPFKAIVAPRPIGWISTVSADGVPNLAPYSFFNAVASPPPIVMFASGGRKDSVVNVEATGEFVCNLVDESLVEAMNVTSIDAPRGVSEFGVAGLAMAPSVTVAPPRVAATKAALECRLTEIMVPKDRHGRPTGEFVVFGEVVGVYIADDALTDGMLDLARIRPVTRLGYMDYATITETWSMRRPRWKDRA